MKEFNSQYIDKIEDTIRSNNADALKAEIADLHPADIAELISHLDTDDAEYLLKQLDEETAADVLIELDEDQRHDLLELMPNEAIARKLEQMDANDAVDVIQELDKEDRDDVIKHIDDVEQAGDIVDLLQYSEDTAGGHMSTEMIVVNENLSMPECIKAMRDQAEDMDEIYNVYVVDDDNRLRGVFPIKKIITNPSASKIKHVMITDPISVTTETPIDDVALDFEKYDLVAMPVVDSIGRLVGRITVDDIMDEVREQSERDYQLASGISTDIETDDNIFVQVKARLPWLVIGMVGGITNSCIIGGYDTSLLQVLPGMAMFIPLIGGTGGNVGTQSSAIVVQGLANGSLNIRNAMRHLMKELGVAMLNAVFISAVVFIYNCINPSDPDPWRAHVTTRAVSLSLFCVVIFASIFGTFVPMTLEKLKIDPAIATGPFISITDDIVGMLIYMSISSVLIDTISRTMFG